jgi:hypothetical protein
MPKQRTSKAKTTRRGEFETPLVPTPEYERWLSDEADAALLEIAKKELRCAKMLDQGIRE